MKIEVGDYVRTINGRIGKIENYLLGAFENGENNYFFEDGYYMPKSDIKKHSKNIIDLIEAGDLVEIILNKDTKATQKFEMLNQEMLDGVKKDLTSVEYLVTILTHEEYERICYKVVE